MSLERNIHQAKSSSERFSIYHNIARFQKKAVDAFFFLFRTCKIDFPFGFVGNQLMYESSPEIFEKFFADYCVEVNEKSNLILDEIIAYIMVFYNIKGSCRDAKLITEFKAKKAEVEKAEPKKAEAEKVMRHVSSASLTGHTLSQHISNQQIIAEQRAIEETIQIRNEAEDQIKKISQKKIEEAIQVKNKAATDAKAALTALTFMRKLNVPNLESKKSLTEKEKLELTKKTVPATVFKIITSFLKREETTSILVRFPLENKHKNERTVLHYDDLQTFEKHFPNPNISEIKKGERASVYAEEYAKRVLACTQCAAKGSKSEFDKTFDNAMTSSHFSANEKFMTMIHALFLTKNKSLLENYLRRALDNLAIANFIFYVNRAHGLLPSEVWRDYVVDLAAKKDLGNQANVIANTKSLLEQVNINFNFRQKDTGYTLLLIALKANNMCFLKAISQCNKISIAMDICDENVKDVFDICALSPFANQEKIKVLMQIAKTQDPDFLNEKKIMLMREVLNEYQTSGKFKDIAAIKKVHSALKENQSEKACEWLRDFNKSQRIAHFDEHANDKWTVANMIDFIKDICPEFIPQLTDTVEVKAASSQKNASNQAGMKRETSLIDSKLTPPPQSAAAPKPADAKTKATSAANESDDDVSWDDESMKDPQVGTESIDNEGEDDNSWDDKWKKNPEGDSDQDWDEEAAPARSYSP